MPILEKTEITADCTAPLERDERWMAVQRLLASPNFSKSVRLSAFLDYICRCDLEGRGAEITDQQIRIHVFSRPPDYNPGDDNIVRTTARQLRQRLALYYQEAGKTDGIRIEVPKGGYHPIFVDLSTQITAEGGDLSSTDPEADSSTRGLHNGPSKATVPHRSPAASLAAVLFGSCIVLLGQQVVHKMGSHSSPVAPLWSSLFRSGQQTVFVAGDAGLNMYDNIARTQVKLSDYVSGSYLASPAAQVPGGYTWASLASRRYVSYVDLTFADELRNVQSTYGAPYSLKFARDIHPEELRDANVILVGGPTYNPWTEMFDSHLAFHFHYDGVRNDMSVLNRRPESGERSEYLPAAEDQVHQGYTHGFGYIAYTTNLEGNGHVLLIEGSTVAGVDASLLFLRNGSKMDSVLKKASAHGALGGFEVLLAANFLKSSSPDAQVLATRFYP